MKVKQKLRTTSKAVNTFLIKNIHWDNNLVTNLKTDFINKKVYSLKKSLKLIYTFHKKGKIILFINPSAKLRKTINFTTIHCNISTLSKKDAFNFKKRNKPDLIVIFDNKSIQKTKISKSILKTTPIITFSNLEKKNLTMYNFKIYNKFFIFNLINSIIKNKSQ